VAEMMIVAPILLPILMATVGFGHWIFSRMMVVGAANRAARLGAVLYGDSSVPRDEAYRATRDAALAFLGSGLRGNDRDVVVQVAGSDIRVTVRYRSGVFVPFLRPWLGDRMEVEHESVYRVESDTT